MARKPKNPDIGEIRCQITGEMAPVRRDCNGKLYYLSRAGMIKPNMPAGQEWMLENARIFSPGEKPLAPITSTDEQQPETPAINEPATVPPESKKSPKLANVPVNGYGGQKPVTGAPSTTQEKAPAPKPKSFVEWLVG